MNEYKLIINDDCSKKDKEIIDIYWSYENRDFINKPKKISHQFDITVTSLTQKAGEYSKVIIKLNCQRCNNTFEEMAYSQTKFKSFINKNNYYCGTCISDIEQENKQRLQEAEKYRIKINIERQQAVNNYNPKTIQDLSVAEKFFLRQIIKFNGNGRSIYGFINHNDYNLSWNELAKFQNLGIIYQIRGEYNRYLEKVLYPENLIEYLNNDRKIAQNKNNFEVNTNEIDVFSFKLSENPLKSNFNDGPIYQSVQTFDKNIQLKANLKYSCSMWKTRNNEVRISFKPVDWIVHAKETSVCNEPKHIRSAIKDFWKEQHRKDI